MSLLAKFIDSLNAKYCRSTFREVIHPVLLNGQSDEYNVILQLNKGQLRIGNSIELVEPGSFYFFPQGEKIQLKLGTGVIHAKMGNEGLLNDDPQGDYVRSISGLSSFSHKKEVISLLGFQLLLYNEIPLFSFLEMPTFPLPADEEFAYLIKHIMLEAEQNKLGREKIMSNYMEEIVIHLFRYMDSQPHLKKYVEKLEFLNDKRLVDIVNYIHDNLDKDLSNKSVAAVAYVSEDYVGQFFKTLTNRNLQEYIENQRLERAFLLLKSQPYNVQEIAHKVGFKDPAYFSRRFKMKFGSNAITIRSNKNYVV